MLRFLPRGVYLLGAAFLATAFAQNPPQGSNPWDLDLMMRSSSEGSVFGPESLFCKASGVPSLIREQRTGRLIAAFQWFPQGDSVNWDRVAVKMSSDSGKTWSEPQPIQVQGLPEGYSRPFDPTLTALADGRVRIYFSSNTSGQKTLDSGVATFSAISTDGVHYTFEPGVRFGVEGRLVIDPAVLKMGETWHYIAPIGRPEDGAYHATSADGLSFTRVEDIPSTDGANWTGNLVAYADGMRFYGSSARGIWWAFSRDGRSWTAPAFLGIQGGDPSLVSTGDASYLMVYVGIPSQAGSGIQVESLRSAYRAARGGTAGFFRTGQAADIMLSGIDFNNTGGALLFNHPGGIGGDGTHILLADRNNNRILVWLSPPQGNTPPDLVLGQPDFTQNNPGAGFNQLNWPCAVSASPNGRIAVADTNNDRLLLWSRFPAHSGEAADLEIQLPGVSSGGQQLGWPWGVWTDGDRLAATATHGGAILFWRTFPVRNNQPPDYVITDPAFGTLRAISSDGSYLVVDDHNAIIPGSSAGANSEQGTFFWRSFPSSPTSRYDFAISGVRLRGGKVDGKLVLLGGGSMRIWNEFPSGPAALPALSIAGSWNSDGVGLAVAGGILYTLDENQNKILAFRSLPAQGDAAPDFAVGSPDTAINTLRTHYFITNAVPASNGTSLFVSSDFDRKLYVWRRLPDESGAYPDLVYSLPEAPWANALLGSTLVLVGKRTIYVWDQLPLHGERPAITLSNTIGNVSLGEIRGVALDQRYFYIADYQAGRIYVWRGIPSTGSNPMAVLDAGGQPVRISSDGTYLAVTILGPPPSVKLYPVASLESGAGPAAIVTRPGFNLPEGALVSGGSLFVADTVFSRVLVWSRISDAIGGRDPDVVLGASDLNDKSPEIGKDKLFWPGALSFDGTFLWVGEFKFSGRLLRFSPGDGSGKSHLVLPKLVNNRELWSGLALTNPAGPPVQATFTIYNNAGSLLGAAALTNPVATTLPSRVQLALMASQLFGEGLNTDGSWVRITSDSSTLAGIFLSFDPEVKILDGTDLSGRFLQSMILPEARGAEISLVNPGNVPAAVTVRLISDEGNTLATASLVIPANGRVANNTDTLFSSKLPSRGGYLEVLSDSRLCSLEEIGLPGIWRATLSPLDRYGGARRLYAPQYAMGGGWHSSVTLINLEDRSTTVSATLFADDGSVVGQPASFNLPARGRMVLSELQDLIAGKNFPLVQGYLRIDSSASRLSGFVRFGDPEDAAFQAALPLIDRGAVEVLFPHVASNDVYFTGLAVINLESDPAELTVTIFSDGGESMATGTLNLAPGARHARLISQLFPNLPLLSKGYIRIRSSRLVAAYAVFGTHSLTALAAIPAQ